MSTVQAPIGPGGPTVMSKTAPLSAVRWRTSLAPWFASGVYAITTMFAGTPENPLDWGRVIHPTATRTTKIGNRMAMTSRWIRLM